MKCHFHLVFLLTSLSPVGKHGMEQSLLAIGRFQNCGHIRGEILSCWTELEIVASTRLFLHLLSIDSVVVL